jgi:hypothetical protein
MEGSRKVQWRYQVWGRWRYLDDVGRSEEEWAVRWSWREVVTAEVGGWTAVAVVVEKAVKEGEGFIAGVAEARVAVLAVEGDSSGTTTARWSGMVGG